jgi:hypothetical protein
VEWSGVASVESTWQSRLEQTRVVVVVVVLAPLALLPLISGSESLDRLMVILASEVLAISASSGRDDTISALPTGDL